MKISHKQLQRLIKEETENVLRKRRRRGLNEGPWNTCDWKCSHIKALLTAVGSIEKMVTALHQKSVPQL
tara:strand:- start:111 stop:317 length:207 start_codon:yes stop_codon:yes gene_type:complete